MSDEDKTNDIEKSEEDIDSEVQSIKAEKNRSNQGEKDLGIEDKQQTKESNGKARKSIQEKIDQVMSNRANNKIPPGLEKKLN